MYVCQADHSLTSLLKLCYLWISVVLDELSFSNFQETFLGCFCTSSKYFQISCMSVSLFIALLPYWNSVNIEYIKFWMSYLSEIFWIYSWYVCSLILNNFRFLVWLSVCSLPYFLTKNRSSVITPVLDELSFSNFLETCFRCLYTSFKYWQISCMSVSLLITSLPYWKKVISDISSSGLAIFSKFSGDILVMLVH